MKTRVALIHEIPSPYREPLFASLASQSDLDVTVVLSAESEARRSWRVCLAELSYPWVMVPSRAVTFDRRGRATWIVPWGIAAALDSLQPDVVILGGYANLPSLAALRWARRNNVPVIMWSESIGPGRRSLLGFKRAVVRRSTACVVPGELAARRLRALGASPSGIFTAPNCIDLELFRPASSGSRELVLLACGRLVPMKGWSMLAPALAEADPTRRVRLLFVGEGPEREGLESDLFARKIPATFTGHVQYADLPGLFAAAESVVFPTLEDVWGFSLQEAMACGLPAIASNRAGATWELVENGVSGWVVDPDRASITCALKKLIALRPYERAAMAKAARASAERLSVASAVEGFRAAIRFTQETSRR